MDKKFLALGFMSGTSGDGVDSSVINSNGKDTVTIKYNRFDPYPASLAKEIHRVKENILEMKDLLKNSTDIDKLELEITNFHADIAIKVSKEINYELIGFHGHTIYHNIDKKISRMTLLASKFAECLQQCFRHIGVNAPEVQLRSQTSGGSHHDGGLVP